MGEYKDLLADISKNLQRISKDLNLKKLINVYEKNPDDLPQEISNFLFTMKKYLEDNESKREDIYRSGYRKLIILKDIIVKTKSEKIVDVDKIPKKTVVQQVTKQSLCKELFPFSDNTYDISGLICMQIAKEEIEWSDILNALKRCAHPPCDGCTKIGYKVAKSLIKVAATRIFAEPEQSIIEPIVNSFDAYISKDPSLKGRKIGKFGMGFFSLLYWLVGHPKRSMLLISTYEENGNYCSYKAKIREDNDSLLFDFTIEPIRRKGRTGFSIIINTERDLFTKDNISEFTTQLEKLLYLEGAELSVIIENFSIVKKTDIIFKNNYNSKNKVSGHISRSTLSVTDDATGVPLDVLLGSLFVPSVSTKTLKIDSSIINEKSEGRIVISQNLSSNGLFILVGKVAVVFIPSSQIPSNKSYLIELPSNTRVPVSRDDIIPTEQTKKWLKEGALSLLDSAASSDRDVTVVQELLEKYIEYTSNSDTKNTIKAALQEFYNINKKNLIYDDKSVYNRWSNFILSKNYDVTEIEKWLDENTDALLNIWYGVKVLILENTAYQATNAGLISYIFVNKSYKESLGKDWDKIIPSSYHNMKLYPYTSEYGKKEFSKYNKFTNASSIMSKLALSRYYNVLMRFDSLTPYFTIESINQSRTYLMSSLIHIYEDAKEIFMDVCDILLRKMGTYKGNQTYGGTRYAISFFMPSVRGEVEHTGTTRKKWLSYLLTHIRVLSLSTTETALTILYIIGPNSPLNIVNTILKGQLMHSVTGIFIDEALAQTENFVEFTLLCTGAGNAFIYVSGLTRQQIRGFIRYMLDRIRARKPTETYLVQIYELWSNTTFSLASVTAVDLRKDYLLSLEWIKTIKNIQEIKLESDDEIIHDMIKSKNKIMLSSLMKYLFINEIPKLEDEKDVSKTMTEFLNKASKTKPTSLQVIEIAINEGTTKPFIDAVLTELIQNSIDAIRLFKPKHDNIDITLTRSKNNNTLYLHITDYVGMDSMAFLYVGIPFLSTKTASELVTGEIGSGFFNVYRESIYVIVDSTKDGSRRISYDVPIKQGDRVIDIEKTYKIVPSKKINMTKITIAIPVSDEMNYISTATKIEYISKYVLGLIPLDTITFGRLGNVHIPRKKVADSGSFKVYMGTNDNFSFESYITTKGVPFAPLSTFAKKILPKVVPLTIEDNFIIDITHGGFAPVQTRTKIRLDPEAKEDFAMSLIYAMFVITIKKVITRNTSWMLDHYESKAGVEQLRFPLIAPIKAEKSILDNLYPQDILKNTKFYNWPTLSQLLNECIDKMDKRTYVRAKKDIDKILKKYNSPHKEIDNYIIQVVTNWLAPKNTSKPEKDSDEEESGSDSDEEESGSDSSEESKGSAKKKKKEVTTKDIIYEPIIKVWVDIWCDLAKDAKIEGYIGNKPKSFAVKSTKPLLGWYDINKNELYVNTETMNNKKRKDVITALKSKNIDVLQNDMLNNTVWVTYFGYNFPSCVLAHELEHYRRKDDHNSSYHTSTTKKMFPDDEIIPRSFDQSANAVYQKVQSMGFYKKLLDRLSEVL